MDIITVDDWHEIPLERTFMVMQCDDVNVALAAYRKRTKNVTHGKIYKWRSYWHIELPEAVDTLDEVW